MAELRDSPLRGTTLLRASGVTKSFPGVRALTGVDFHVEAGEVNALVGENGAGKSTLINLMSGQFAPDEGTIVVGDEPLKGGPLGAHAAGVATIYQKQKFVPSMTVAENIMLGHWPGRGGLISRREMRRKATEALSQVAPHLSPQKVAAQLTPAEAQEVEIARALSRRSRVLIMDEPTTSLSTREIDRLFTIVRGLRSDGMGIVFVSHWLEEVMAIADRITVLRDGALVGTAPVADLDRPQIIKMMVGREVKETPPASRTIGSKVLEVSGLSRFGSFEDVSLTVHQGEIVTLSGLVGAGRTELARCIFGVDRYDAGSVLVDGAPVKPHSIPAAIRAGLGLVPEDRHAQGLVDQLGVGTNLTMSVLEQVAPRWLLSPKREAEVVNRYSAAMRIKAASPAVRVSTLSGGNQQKVVIGRWLARHPKLLILDEPTKGVDIGAKAEITALIGELAASGVGILLITSELPEVLLLSDRVLVMRTGSLVADLDRQHTNAEEIMHHATMAGPA
jgi:ABC-type sugar transport system ATPase subunit